MNKNYLKQIGSRILSEANDLKRTIDALAKEIGLDRDYLVKVIEGNASFEDARKVIGLMGEKYPIDSSDLYLIDDDCKNGVIHFSSQKSKESSRIFNRLDSNGNKTPYYEYRDTAMSKISPFKPEWIKEIRVVNDSNPKNPDVAYNNGHFMHQITFFVGPVNFYYIKNGKSYCEEMNTGDSNYITPFTPHSFTSRNKDKVAYIVAITFGGDVRRAQKEIYSLGLDKIQNYYLDIRNKNKAISQLVSQHLSNECLTEENIPANLEIKNLLNPNIEKSLSQLESLANFLNIDSAELSIPEYNSDHEVVIHKKNENNSYFYPNNKSKLYKIYPGARATKLPSLKSFELVPLSTNETKKNYLETALHSYIFNYGESIIKMKVVNGSELNEYLLNPGDSSYIQPFVKHSFNLINKKDYGSLFIARTGGHINSCTQREMSYFLDINRTVSENSCWFD